MHLTLTLVFSWWNIRSSSLSLWTLYIPCIRFMLISSSLSHHLMHTKSTVGVFVKQRHSVYENSAPSVNLTLWSLTTHIGVYRTSSLKSCISYIHSTNIGTEYFKRGIYSPFFSSSKCILFHNSNVFGSCIIHILYTVCAKVNKNNSGAQRLMKAICCVSQFVKCLQYWLSALVSPEPSVIVSSQEVRWNLSRF